MQCNLLLCWSVSLVRDVKAIWSNLQMSWFIWTQKVIVTEPFSELAQDPLRSWPIIPFQTHPGSSSNLTQDLLLRPHRHCHEMASADIKACEPLESSLPCPGPTSELAQDPLQSSPMSSSEFVRCPIPCSNRILFRHQRIQVRGWSVCWLTCCQATICFKRWCRRTTFASKTDFAHTPIIHYQFAENVA